MAEAKTTTDHEVIRRWAEERNGRPAIVGGILRIDFPGRAAGEDQLEHISWDDWFRTFDENQLELLYPDGEGTTFFKLVRRE
jgi:hypothetical protein